MLSIGGFVVLGQAVGPVNHSTPNGHLVTTKQEEYPAGKEYFKEMCGHGTCALGT